MSSIASLSRRAVLLLAAGGLSGCAVGMRQGPWTVPVSAIRVSGTRNRELARLAVAVARELADQLGDRYKPGTPGGGTLMVDLTDAGFEFGGGRIDGFNDDVSPDVLDSRVSFIGAGGKSLVAFPLLATALPIDSSVMRMDVSDNRIDNLAHSYTYWLVRKLP